MLLSHRGGSVRCGGGEVLSYGGFDVADSSHRGACLGSPAQLILALVPSSLVSVSAVLAEIVPSLVTAMDPDRRVSTRI
jgi:hypothetical protein